jgi:O-antigen/teichoic acid export membrane protein
VGTQLNKISTQVLLQGIAVLLNLAMVIFISRICGAELRGAMSIYNTTMYFATLIGCCGLGSAFTYFVASKKISAGACHSLSIILALVVGYLSSIFLHWFAYYKGPDYLLGVHSFSLPRIFVFQLCFTVYTTLVSAIYVGKQKPTIGILAQVLQLILFASFVWFTFDIMGSTISMQARYIFRNMAIAYGFVTAVLFLVSFFYIGFGWPHKVFMQNLAPYAGLVLAANLVQTLCYRADIWFLKWNHVHTADIGVYSIAALFTQMLWLVPSQIANTQFGLVSAGQNINASSIVGIAKCLLWYSLIVFIVGLVLAYFLVPPIFGKQFMYSVPLALVLMPGAVLICGSIAVSTYNSGTNQVRINLMGSLVALLFCVAGYLFFIPRYGAWAAAGVSSMGYATTTIYYYRIFCKQQSVRFAEFFSLKNIGLKNFMQYWKEIGY